MSSEQELMARSDGRCELCSAESGLESCSVPASEGRGDADILLCQTCRTQLENPAQLDAGHWRCLGDSMWSQVPAVQVTAWRLLKRLSGETWAQDLLDMLYLDEDQLAWAQAGALPGRVRQSCTAIATACSYRPATPLPSSRTWM
ncbi:hypothetical protein [Microbulbifer taiwanensis]|uniref:hypothetical protein n=1 Tax=Microbulbifer taiwanensis TaxID=986746 RepID=UPI003611D3EE